MQQLNDGNKVALLVQGLGQALLTGNPEEIIKTQEQSSQQELVTSQLLPSRLDPEVAKEFLEKFGVIFLPKEEDVSLFQPAILPPGWKKVVTDNPWLSMLLDQNGREIARLFYKGTHYEQIAALIIQPRYGIWEGESDNIRNYPSQSICATVIDGGTVLGKGEILYMTNPKPASQDKLERLRTLIQAKKEARNWLKENYPDWENPFAYWQV